MTTKYKQYIYKNGEWMLLGSSDWDSSTVISNSYLLKATTQNGVAHATTTSGNTFINLIENGVIKDKINLYPTGGISITSDTTGKISFTNTGVRSISKTSNGTLSINTNGTTSPITVYELPTASSNNLGGIKIGDNLTISNGVVSGKPGTITSITLKAGEGISLDTDNTAITSSGTRTITNSGVRSISESATNGYISVNTNGTTTQVFVHGLGDRAFDSTTYLATSTKGAANGVAPLNGSSKIDSTYLPSYVDDVLEYASSSNFPTTGTSGIIYLAQDTGFIYRWSGTTYVNVSADTNTTYTISTGNSSDPNGSIRITPSVGTSYPVSVKGLTAAAYKAVDTSISAGSSSANLPTSAAVAAFVEGKGYVTSSGITSVTAANNVGIGATTTGSSVALTNTGVRAVSEGSTNGTISVNTNGTTTSVAVHGLGSRAFDSTSYLPLTGGTMTGNITLGSETSIAAEIKRKKADGEGWAYAPYRFIGNDGVTFANIGVYGGEDALTYMYIGAEDYSSSNNLRIYPNGTISAQNFTGNVTGVASGNLTNVAYDSTNKRITKTIGGTTSDVVTLATLKTAMFLDNVENTKLSTWAGSTNITTLGTISSGTVPLARVSGADDLKAIEALTGTAGILKKTAANTWALDTSYVSISNLLTDGTEIGKLTINGTTVSLKAPTPAGLYVLPTAASDTLGGIKTGYTTSGNNRAVQVDSNGNAYVVQKDNNDNTTYTITTGGDSDPNGSIRVTPSSGTSYPVSVKGLAAAAYKGVTDNSTATAVTSSDTNLITARTLYNAGYVKSSGVTSITLTAGDGIGITNSGTAITTTGTRTITNTGVRSITEGTTNGAISVNTNGTTASVAVHGLAAAAYKGVTDNSSATAVTSTDTNLITARTLYNAGYVKSSGVTNIAFSNGGGIGISGSPITSTGTITLTNAGVRSISAGTNNGTLSVNTNGTTTTITLTDAPYLSLAQGGTVTGEVTFNNTVSVNDEFSADSATVGNFIATGAGRFTNGIFGDLTGNVTGTATGNLTNVAWDSTNKRLTKTINGTTSEIVTVANMLTAAGISSPMQFIGTLGTGGTATSLAAAAAANKGYTYKVITDGTYQSVAAKVGDVLISNGSSWILVPSGDEPSGTVTNVAASGSGGISISGSPITSSGTIAIGLNLSTAINGLSEGTSPAQRDDYIVAQYAGGGTTTTTYHRRKLSNIFAALNSSDITTALGYTPPTSDTNTHRPIQVNGTEILGNNTTALNLKAGSNVSITNSSGTVTIAASNTDTKVTQAYSTTNNSYPLLMSTTAGVSSTSSRGDTTTILNNALYANPSTGTLRATTYSVADNGTITYNSTTGCVEIICA